MAENLINSFNPIDEILNELKQFDLVKTNPKNLITNKFYFYVGKNLNGENISIQYFYYVSLIEPIYYTDSEYYLSTSNFSVGKFIDSYYNICLNFLTKKTFLFDNKYLNLSIQNIIPFKIIIYFNDFFNENNNDNVNNQMLNFNSNHSFFYNFIGDNTKSNKFIYCKF